MRRLQVHASCFVVLLAVAPLARAGDSLDGSWPRFRRIVVLPDTSGSLDPGEFAAVTTALARELPDLAIAAGAREVALLPWAESWDALRTASRAALPLPPTARHAESQLTEGQLVFRRARELAREREAGLRQARLAALECEYRGQVRESLGELMARIGATHQGRSASTDVQAILRRCAREGPGTLCLVVTDGLQEGTTSAGHIGELPTGSRVVVVLVPSRAATGDTAADFDARARWLHETAPWTSVAFSFQASGSIEGWLLPLLDTGRHDAAGHGPSAR